MKNNKLIILTFFFYILASNFLLSEQKLKYQIIIPGKAESNGQTKAAKIYNMYYVAPEHIVRGVIHLKTKANVPVDKYNKAIYSASIMNILTKYNVKNFRNLVSGYENSQILRNDTEGLSKIVEINFSPEYDSYDICMDLMENPEIEYACPVFKRYCFDYTPNDPEISKQWAIDKLQMKKAWSITKGDTNVRIAIVDSGTDWKHPDLLKNIWTNPNEIAGNGIDDDKNGKIDDVRGWDLIGNVSYNDISMGNFKEDGDATNIGGYHGTHVAGCASAATDNKTGVAGIGFNCMLIPIKCSIDNSQAGIFRGYDGLLYAASVKADIVNCSWGGPGFSPSEQDIITTLTKAGILIVVAAANDNKQNIDEEAVFPAAYENVLCVGATQQDDQAASFSNIGYKVTVYTPGKSIYATMPSNSYGNLDGTSMATPVTSGICALVKSIHPNWSPKMIAHQLRSTSENVVTKDSTQRPYYFGRANALNALEYNGSNPSKSVPGVEITNVTFSSGDAITDYNPVNVKLTVKNFLGDANNLRMIIKQVGASINVSTPTVNIGTLLTNQEKELDMTVQLTKMSPWYAGYANLYITFESGSYKDFQIVQIPVVLASKNNFSNYYNFMDGYSPTWTHAYAVNEDIVWGCGYGGAAFNWRGGGIRIAGATPSMGTLTGVESGENLYCVYAFDANKAFMGSGKSSSKTAKVFRTLDGGSSWSNTNVSSITDLVIAIHFFTEDYGIILGNPLNGKFGIGVSQDGGLTYKAITNAPAPNTGESGNPGSAYWLKTYGWFGTNKGRVFRTTDMGQSWKASTINKAAIVYQMLFKDVNNGIAVYAESTSRYAPRLIASTNDGGATWKSGVFNFGAMSLVPVYLYSHDETNLIIMLCSTGQVYGTTDNGASWSATLSQFHGVVQAGAAAFYGKNKMRLWDFGESIGHLDFSFLPKTLQKSFSLTQNSVVFDTTLVGNSKTKNISIQNTGNYDIKTSFELTSDGGSNPDEFKFLGDSILVIEPEKSSIFRVKFSPQADGLRTAKLKISSDGNPAEQILSISGFGAQVNGIDYLNKIIMKANVFPNPSDGFFSLSYYSEIEEEMNIIVTDITGRKIKELFSGYCLKGKNEHLFNLRELSAGSYYITINGSFGNHNEKLIIY